MFSNPALLEQDGGKKGKRRGRMRKRGGDLSRGGEACTLELLCPLTSL